ncbi:MAG: small multi-drug export protein [Lachnospiraceae bacterium]|jgi:uncharacterized membrane protein
MSKYFYVFFIAMLPLIELRGAVPVAVGFHTADPSFNMVAAYILIALGNMLPVPFIFFFARRVLEWGADKKFIGKFFSWCLDKGHKGGAKLQKSAGHGLYWALLLFVGVPLPGTGAWTGTLAASFLDMDFKKSCIAIMGGVALAGVIMSLISFGTAAGWSLAH